MPLTKARKEAKQYIASLLERELQAAQYEVSRLRSEIKVLAERQASAKRRLDELGKLIGQVRKEMSL